MNAAWLAGAPLEEGVAGLETIWRSLRRNDVFPVRFGLGLAGFVGKRASLFDASGLHRLLRQYLTFDRLEDAPIPLHVVVTDVLDGRDVAMSRGPAIDLIAASSAIPGVFPPVAVDGRMFMDGGVVNNAPISHAIKLGADVVYVLPTGYACSLEQAPSSALGMTLHALSLMVNQRLSSDIDHYLDHVDLRVVPPPCPINVGPSDFGRAAELIERGYETAGAWLRAQHGRSGANPIALHEHRHRNDAHRRTGPTSRPGPRSR